MSQPLWTLRNVTLKGRHRPRLSGVSVEIPAGVTAIVGPSGAGKSSLLNLLVGFERPSSGEIICHYTPAAGQLGVYWLPPGDGLWGHLTVRQHLQNVQPAAAKHTSLIDDVLSQLDLQLLSDALPDDLSQGERARLALARALASQAAVLVVDEPLVHVSQPKQPDYWRVIREYCGRQGTSMVVALHDLAAVTREAHHVMLIEAGKLFVSGPVSEVLKP